MYRTRITPFLRNACLLIAGVALVGASPAHADLNSDLAFTDFSNVDINALAGGQVMQMRGPMLEFQRGITAQSLFIINAEPATVQQKLVHWDPAAHSELKVWIHKLLPAKPTAADFAGLSGLPNNSSVSYLIDATAKLSANSPALQVDKSEAQWIAPMAAQNTDKRALFTHVWSQLLANRASNFLGGKFGSATYVVNGNDLGILKDVTSLFRADPKVYQAYHSLLSQTPIYSSTKAAPAGIYYDCFDVEGYGALGTGAIFQAPSGNAIQSVDIEYYVNSGIYTTIELETLWPITVNGKTETLVWREDLVSTSNVAYLHGMERMASSMLMLQDVKQAVDAFRAEFK
jgi:hypothetical protein